MFVSQLETTNASEYAYNSLIKALVQMFAVSSLELQRDQGCFEVSARPGVGNSKSS